MTADAQHLVETFSELFATLVRTEDVIDFAQLLANGAARFSDSDHAGIVITDPAGAHIVIAATTQDRTAIQRLQNTSAQHQDASVDSPANRQPDDLLNTSTPRGAALFATVKTQRQVLGAMVILRDRTVEFSDDERAIAHSLASIAAIGLTRGDRNGDPRTAALADRALVDRAKTSLTSTHHISADDAYALLRRRATETRIGITALARQLLAAAPSSIS